MNISEIAGIAGVSRATVSRFLNDGYVSQEKRDKIQKVIDETGYMPSSHAQILRTKRTNLIGIVVPKISSESISRVVEGISNILSQYGYNILLGNTENDTTKELNYLNIFKNKQVDGIIFIATIFTKEHISIMSKIRVPLVVIGQETNVCSCVYHDDFGASFELCKLMIDKGRDNLAFIGVTTKDKAAGAERIAGFMKALEEKHLTIDGTHLTEGLFTQESGYINMKKIYEFDPFIDGVFCATDTIAIGAMKYLKERNIQIGKDLSLVGIGDTNMSKVVTPMLTSAHFYYKTCGKEAAKMLIDMLHEKKVSLKKLKLGFEIINRESI